MLEYTIFYMRFLLNLTRSVTYFLLRYLVFTFPYNSIRFSCLYFSILNFSRSRSFSCIFKNPPNSNWPNLYSLTFLLISNIMCAGILEKVLTYSIKIKHRQNKIYFHYTISMFLLHILYQQDNKN